MPGETELDILIKSMRPRLQEGEYVFCTAESPEAIDMREVIAFFREDEAVTLIIRKETADRLALPYSFVAAWITLTVHSSLEAVGLTAAFSRALGDEGISCNVVAAYYHDHIFVNHQDAEKAMTVLQMLSA